MTISVTVCSTWMRVFISRKNHSPSGESSPSIVPGAAIADGARRGDGDLADPCAQLVADRGRRRLLDELLVPALDRAVALAEEEDVPVRVGEDLRLDVARILEVALDVDRVVGEVRLALAPGRLERALRLVRRCGRP